MDKGIWISFANISKPKGEMFAGVIIVKAKNDNAAVARVIELGLWPKITTLDVALFPTDIDEYTPIDRMLTEMEAATIGERVVTVIHTAKGNA